MIMDPLSGVASVVAVVQLAQLICGVLKEYFHKVREARADIDRMFTTIKSLERILAQAEKIAKRPHTNDVEIFLVDLSGPIGQLKGELDRIRRRLEAPSLKGRLGGLVQSLRWPFRNKEVEKSVQIIEQHKSTLSANLGFQILDFQINHFDIVTSIQQDIKHAQDDRDRKLLVRWLADSVPDPSREHNAARNKYEEGTGSWLIDSVELRSWSSTSNSFLWLSGGPGAGKSMLCSTVIESLKARCRWQKHSISVVAYWYFSFASKETQSISNFLCSIARDLCSKVSTMPKVVEDLWSDANNGQQRPSVPDLLNMLRALLPNFNHAFLVVDAADEYPKTQRGCLLRTIQSLSSLNMECLHLLVVSRPEADIHRSFKEIGRIAGGFREIKVQGIRVQRDIEKYLDHILRSTPFRNWNPGEKREIKSILTSQADDMFRLVSLQLERLGTLPSRAKRREALKMLPKSLDDFYHGLLEGVNDDNLGVLKKALNWLLLSARPLTVAELAEAVIISPDRPFLDPEERFDDEHYILAILPGGFVRILSETSDRGNFEGSGAEEENDKSHRNPDRFSLTVQLAHQSVKDYLLSTRVARQEFRVDRISACNMLKEACMAYFVYVAQAPPPPTQDPFHEFALLRYVSTYWPYHMAGVKRHDEVLVQYLAVNIFQNSLGVSLEQGVIGDNKGYFLANELRFPCSRGSPCEQCARLSLRRQWALRPCLDDCIGSQLDSRHHFLVPDYLMSHFAKANVEQFVARNASSWGTKYFLIRMDWGYRKFLTAEVVALTLRSDSEMGYQYCQTVLQEGSRLALLRKQSPPLGIPLAAMDDMQYIYSQYIQDIVQSDLAEYVSVAYPEQETDFAERLLGVISSYYDASRQMDNESELLRRALEMHVTSVILERKFILDTDSLYQVQDHLHQQYPEQSAPIYAQRQIKLAFFLLQQQRIIKVLKDWGNMMWAINSSISKDKEWALAFSVFVTLILVIDKIIGAAYYFCEGRIKYHGYQVGLERAEFQKLVRLTQRELFDRCKEIFHWKFKTRKGGKAACNPIRDGAEAFQSMSKSVDLNVIRFVKDLQNIVGDFEQDVRSYRSSRQDMDSEYTDAGRLALIFLNDFLGR
ncbi:uncharacterized protein PAC_12640 [Phialocephala subalpina]|uniref:Nephrocystin 3-like N-terminal domain-containing protein n=1 Tax=Phialocephala subalpina TaxID=576137 RepID=A0A1L7XCK2_9HELO|nr:uncharacterized protein PAC_12640 [Phialocephala subalpina]